MSDTLVLERELAVPPERLFDSMTQPHQMQRWWTRDGMTIPEHGLNFGREGPWYAVLEMLGASRKMVSGRVTRVDRPRHLAFTWAWHDGGPSGPRGALTYVQAAFSEPRPGFTRLVLTHGGLPNAVEIASHRDGWVSILNNMERGLTLEGA